MSPTSFRPLPVAGAIEPYLDHLAHLVADHGITAFESDIARLVVRLRAAGYHCPLVDLLADQHAPAVVRERAFGTLLPLLIADPARRAGDTASTMASSAASAA